MQCGKRLSESVGGYVEKVGCRAVDERVGRVDKLESRRAVDHWKARGLNLDNLMYKPEPAEGVALYHCEDQKHGLENAMDHLLIDRAATALENETPDDRKSVVV